MGMLPKVDSDGIPPGGIDVAMGPRKLDVEIFIPGRLHVTGRQAEAFGIRSAGICQCLAGRDTTPRRTRAVRVMVL